MKFYEVVDLVIALLQTRARVSYRALKREFDLDDAYLEDLKEEIIGAQRLAVDESGKFLVWAGEAGKRKTATRGNGNSEEPPATSFDVRRQTSDSRHEAERRQLTVMFVDLVGSTSLSEQLDPEELREVIRAYQEVCARVINRFGGYIAQYLGDGLLVYLGYPMAYEDEPHRAVWTGLEIIAALRTLSVQNVQLPQPLQVRVGIHTGQVVVGEMGGRGRTEQLALGEAPNVAARLQGLAAPDEVLISVATHRLVRETFECEDIGPQTLKGVSTAVTVYRVFGASQTRSRFKGVPRTGVTPLVGREREVEFLIDRWERVKQGEGQVVLVSGEAGIGKSRLVQELNTRVAQEGAICIELQCSPYYLNSPLHSLIEHIQRVLRFQKGDSPQTKFVKLKQALAAYQFPEADTLSLLATLLSLPLPDGAPPLNLSPQRQRQKTYEVLVKWLLEDTQKGPVYCTWNDLHWADPSTLEFLGLCLDQVPATRMLAVLIFRPDFMPPWGSRAYVSQLTLGRLGRLHVKEMVKHVAGERVLPAEIVQQVVNRTDGVPLFVEELTKTVLESGFLKEGDGHYELTGPLPLLAIPVTLRDSLEARLDRLGTGKEVAQLGATLGREFSYELIQAVAPLTEETLQEELTRLVEADLLHQRGLPPHATYVFRQTLVQEAAYHSLLKSTQQHYHRRVAQVLAEQFPDTVETQPELLAHHYTEGGSIEQALPHWQQAGQRAVERSAHVEAIGHLTKGLELLQTLPDTPERTRRELALRLTLGTPLVATQGYAARAVESTYTRALELCRQIGETPELFQVLFGLWRLSLVRGESQTARDLAEQCLRIAQSTQDTDFLMTAHVILGLTLFDLGELIAAQEHLEQSLALYDGQRHRPDQTGGALYGQDPKVIGLSYAAMTSWVLGYPDQALTQSQQAVAAAWELAHPFSLVFALDFAGAVHRFRREARAVQEKAESVIELSREQGFPFWLASGTIGRGWALVSQGQIEEGIEQIQQGLAARQVAGVGGEPSYLFVMLVEAYRKAGKAEEGLTILGEGIEKVSQNRARCHTTELYRLKGELTLQKTVDGRRSTVIEQEAEACFRQAIDLARWQSAKSLELRAATSLARLWQRQGKNEEARALLAEIYDWFTEGFDTADLKEARILLEQLSR